jgi:vacuolar-type H+-ATPase subunit C/Vma6
LLEVIRESKDLKISENILSEFVKTNDDFWLEMAFKDSLDDLGLRSIRASPFDLGLTLYFLIMKRNEVNRIKIIARFVKEGLPREDLKKIIGA